jgi:hypothetical protein
LLDLFEAWGKNAEKEPFGDLLEPGEVIAIKPNSVRYHNPSGYGIECLITHLSLIKYVIDFAARVLGEHSKIMVGDRRSENRDSHPHKLNSRNTKRLSPTGNQTDIKSSHKLSGVLGHSRKSDSFPQA